MATQCRVKMMERRSTGNRFVDRTQWLPVGEDMKLEINDSALVIRDSGKAATVVDLDDVDAVEVHRTGDINRLHLRIVDSGSSRSPEVVFTPLTRTSTGDSLLTRALARQLAP